MGAKFHDIFRGQNLILVKNSLHPPKELMTPRTGALHGRETYLKIKRAEWFHFSSSSLKHGDGERVVGNSIDVLLTETIAVALRN